MLQVVQYFWAVYGHRNLAVTEERQMNSRIKKKFNAIHPQSSFLTTTEITINVPLFKKLRDIIFFFAGQ
jgi:hypothetical protein